MDSITKWVFKETGVLSLGAVSHHLVGEKYAPEYYTVRDKVVRLKSDRVMQCSVFFKYLFLNTFAYQILITIYYDN